MAYKILKSIGFKLKQMKSPRFLKGFDSKRVKEVKTLTLWFSSLIRLAPNHIFTKVANRQSLNYCQIKKKNPTAKYANFHNPQFKFPSNLIPLRNEQ